MVESREFQPDPGWLKDPELHQENEYIDDMWVHQHGDGWESRIAQGPDQWVRCDAPYPDNTPDDIGSCAGVVGHEHPHFWVRYGFRLHSISRKVRVNV